MAYVINEDCIACGTCVDECPVDAISEGDIYKIDAEACTDCGTCADVCPSAAQSTDKEPSWETNDPVSNEGLETWYLSWDKCIRFGGPWDCVSCQTSCPFNHGKDAIIHPVVKAVAGVTPIFNSFFANMEDAFGYFGQLSDQEHTDWWYRDLKTWPYDTLLGVGVKEW
mgnify:CR=1 FL=1